MTHIDKPQKKTVIGFIISYLISFIPIIYKLYNVTEQDWNYVVCPAIFVTVILVISIFMEPAIQFLFIVSGAVSDYINRKDNDK